MGQHMGKGSSLPSKADVIRRQIAIHLGPNPSYDDLWAFFLSYSELFTLYNEGRLPHHSGSSGSPSVFPPHLRHTLEVIADLVAHGRLPTTDDLEFVGMVDGGGDLVFDALYMDLDSDHASLKSSEEAPLSDGENEGRPTLATPALLEGQALLVVPAKWGATCGRI